MQKIKTDSDIGIKEDILKKIIYDRIKRIDRYGHTQGLTIPDKRQYPVIPFGRAPFIITEIKRCSPSRGNIAGGMDIYLQAEKYVKQGSRNISVLTEEQYFGGSLSDLMTIKARFPQISILRKDFLLDEADVDVSYRAGADAVLLIAGILDDVTLRLMYDKTKELGIAALVEVHSLEELERISVLEPEFVGINSRDLVSFNVDILTPVKLRRHISWDARVVFESGLWEFYHAYFASSSGAAGILVGEALMREPERFEGLAAGLSAGQRTRAEGQSFWQYLMVRLEKHRPLVKICGLTREEDVAFADRLGADLLGFVLADSPRRVNRDFLSTIGRTQAKKIGVVVEGQGISIEDAVALVKDGLLDALQFHGDEPKERLMSLDIPWYKAARIEDVSDMDSALAYNSPRLLIDAKSEHAYGGTGKSIDDSLIDYAKTKTSLWIAGGLSPDNIKNIVRKYNPELVDVSSGVEESPGKKDKAKLKQFFEELFDAAL
ncbi:bifunctional indole-3-glycerol phosphate synthase/phosphoribosylanthranilate isomerase [Spirochaetia bacterium 38H-sp]|uniref:N-(5'-phosphoribosyl)anthranilate isomerase n=1 Tax=Rarispira pelagica TaxID=3141764 RepID=A0ABU9U9M5_9SPIR